jgi:hypothetical protein
MLLLVGVESIFANDLAVKRKPKKGKYKNYDPRKTLFYFGGGLMALPIRGYNFSSVSGNESVLKYAYKPEKVTPIWRLEQMLEKTFDTLNGGQIDIKKTGDYIRNVMQDVLKEDLDILKDANLEPKDIGGKVSEISRKFLFEQI